MPSFRGFLGKSSLDEGYLVFTNHLLGGLLTNKASPGNKDHLLTCSLSPGFLRLSATNQKVLQVPFLLGKSIPHPQRGGLRSAKLGAIRKLSLVPSLPVEVERSGSKLKPQLPHLLSPSCL